MLTNSGGAFETLVTRLLSDLIYEKSIEQAKNLYQIKPYKIQELTPAEIHQMYYQVAKKQSREKFRYYFRRKPTVNQPWHENQLRIFVWLLVGYAFIEGKHISALVTVHHKQRIDDWKYFSEIFNKRNPEIFQFQSKVLIKREKRRTRWDRWYRQQNDLLDSLIKKKRTKNKWNQVAKELFIYSGKRFFRTAKQCRQRWISHLNPKTTHQQWNLYEDLEIAESVKEYGKKWAKVSKAFGGKRTQHMVKNRYRSLLKLQAKKYSLKKIASGQIERQMLEIIINQLKYNIEQKEKQSQNLPEEDYSNLKRKEKQQICLLQQNESVNEITEQKSSQELISQELNANSNCFNFFAEDEQSLNFNKNYLFGEDCLNIFFQDSPNFHS